MVDSDDNDNVELSWVEKGNKRFFSLSLLFLFYAFTTRCLSIFNFLFFTYSIHQHHHRRQPGELIEHISEGQVQPSCSHFLGCSLSFSLYSFITTHDFFKCSLYFTVWLFCSSNVTLTVCFKRMFPLTAPTLTPCRLRIIIG